MVSWVGTGLKWLIALTLALQCFFVTDDSDSSTTGMMQWALMPISFNRVGVNEGFILFWFSAGITELVCWAARNLNTKNTKKFYSLNFRE